MPGRGTRRFHARVRIGHPRLWWIERPYLYTGRLRLMNAAGNVVQRYTVHTGIRTLRVSRLGRLQLNGRDVNLRGASIHEDSLSRGAALTPGQMRRNIGFLRELGAHITRAHYPLHPYELELADRYGILVWSEIPVYRMASRLFDNRRGARQGAADAPQRAGPRLQPPVDRGLERRQRERLAASARA